MATLNLYLSFENAKEAMDYYVNALNAVIVARMPVNPDMAQHFDIPEGNLDDTTMHGQFTIVEGDVEILVSDRFGLQGDFSPVMKVHLDFDSESEADTAKLKRFYEHVRDSGLVTVTNPLADQFWGGAMGHFTDKYGIQWQLHSQPYSKLHQTLGLS